MYVGFLLIFSLLAPGNTIVKGQKLMSEDTLSRRTLNRFRRSSPDNHICWDRNPNKDSFFNVIDTHNHFRPFGGPPVAFDTYFQWMKDAGILFSTMFGIGQKIEKKHQSDPECCYYLHCPTFDHLVVPNPANDRANAEDYVKYKTNANQSSQMHLLLSATFPNLQVPGKIMSHLNTLRNDFPGAFKWAGEINVIKHALVGNGFFKEDTSPRLTKKFIEDGNLDPFFRDMEANGWPVTLHMDLGCDNYDAIPLGALDNNPVKYCQVPESEWITASKDYEYWQDVLGEFYPAFFSSKKNEPILHTFRKIQHLPLMTTLLDRFPKLKVVWPHLGLSKELRNLHPKIHTHIFEYLFKKYENLFIDISWDILAKLVLLNFDEMIHVEQYSSKVHTDIHEETTLWNNTHVDQLCAIREALHEKWEEIKPTVHATGSNKTLNGPTYAFAIYLDSFEKYPERFITGTDFVSSMGEPDKYPGMQKFKFPPSGCMKDEANHKRQVTDTSAINPFLSDNAFRKIVLGENYFKMTGLDSEFQAPKVCHTEKQEDMTDINPKDQVTCGASSMSSPLSGLRKSMVWILETALGLLFHSILVIMPH